DVFAGSAALQCRSCASNAREDAPLEWRAPGKDLARNQRRRILRVVGNAFREGEPVVLLRGPDRTHRRREVRIGEGADGDADDVGQAFVLPEHGRAALGTEMKGQHRTAVGLTAEGAALAFGADDLRAREEGAGAEQRTGAAL